MMPNSSKANCSGSTFLVEVAFADGGADHVGDHVEPVLLLLDQDLARGSRLIIELCGGGYEEAAALHPAAARPFDPALEDRRTRFSGRGGRRGPA